MTEMQDKLEKVKEFIQANPGKSNKWYAEHNGIVKRATFYKHLNDIVIDRSIDRSIDTPVDTPVDTPMDTPVDRSIDTQTDGQTDKTDTSEIIENIFEEHEKNEDRKSKNRQYNYNSRSRKALVEELQKENEELKSKYEELKSKYEQLQTDFIFERQLKDKYANQIHDFPFKQSEFDELKDKYERLQIEYIALKTGDKPQDKSDKPKSKNQTQWWEEI